MQAPKVDGNLTTGSIVDFFGMDDPKLHGNQAIAKAKVGIRNRTGDDCLHRVGVPRFGTHGGWIDEQQIDHVRIPVPPTPRWLSGTSRIRGQSLFEFTSTTGLGGSKPLCPNQVFMRTLERIPRSGSESNCPIKVVPYSGKGKKSGIRTSQTTRPGKRSLSKIRGTDLFRQEGFLSNVHSNQLRGYISFFQVVCTLER